MLIGNQGMRASPACVSIVTLLLLAACGGGGGGDTATADAGGGIESGSSAADESDPPASEDSPSADPSTEGPPPDGSPTQGAPSQDMASCSVAAQNQWVYEQMLDYYLFYDQVPVLNPADYPDTEEFLQLIRFDERDPFSHIRDADEADLEAVEGREFGLGFKYASLDDGSYRLSRVLNDSPFGRAGLERGDIIVSVDGRSAAEIFDGEGTYFDDVVLGTPESPGRALWSFEDRDTGAPFSQEMVASEYAINTVHEATQFTHESYDGRIGYLAFTRFLETSETELRTEFAQFQQDGVTDLVVDLRYNRGGRIYIAEQLASLIAGPTLSSALLQEYRFNDKYAAQNYQLLLGTEPEALSLRGVVFLVKSNTASASELVVNGLIPHVDVTVLGSRATAGKPYRQLGRDNCGKKLNAIDAEGVNAREVSVFGGIQPACFAADDYYNKLGYNQDTGAIEGMLLAGLDNIVFGTCEPFAPAKALSAQLDEAEGDQRQGFIDRGGAY